MRCLRPSFTNTFIRILQKENSINLVAQDGQGIKRFLEDIKNSKLRNTKVLFVDMKDYTENYEGLIEALWKQFGKRGKSPKEFWELITKFETTGKKIIILMYNFDDLLNNSQTDQKFDVAFFKHLDNLKDKINISLSCVTNQPHDHSPLLIKGKMHGNSWLDLEKIRLPKLTHDEIRFELRGRNLLLSSYELSQVTWALHAHTHPYRLLKFFAEKMARHEDKNLDISLRIEKWVDQFSHENFFDATKKINRFKQFLLMLKGVTTIKLPTMATFWESFKFVGKKS
ncbi:hypothetical protein [Candidatus Parabeggiatoa sp. HSG14]|uniref:hypothetical protein n=1 Tax=Candidatus Parabeggiatoa sp. HSG14 TaxID=3055593 RepID=UPI0025A6C79B|nr:hypothetical protein [Thiotrichales bacterium HSG14]